jgi:hypothetical protein
MPQRSNYVPRPQAEVATTPFTSAEEAWFWFMQNQMAKADGARIAAGLSLVPRPCEPVDIYKVMERLYRSRRLLMDHILVLRHYGRRLMPPDIRHPKEIRAHQLWTEALTRMEDIMISKGIVPEKKSFSWKEMGECYA